jgi:hypothetical protein
LPLPHGPHWNNGQLSLAHWKQITYLLQIISYTYLGPTSITQITINVTNNVESILMGQSFVMKLFMLFSSEHKFVQF